MSHKQENIFLKIFLKLKHKDDKYVNITNVF